MDVSIPEMEPNQYAYTRLWVLYWLRRDGHRSSRQYSYQGDAEQRMTYLIGQGICSWVNHERVKMEHYDDVPF